MSADTYFKCLCGVVVQPVKRRATKQEPLTINSFGCRWNPLHLAPTAYI